MDNEKNSELVIILEKLDKADADREKILDDLNGLSKVIAENHLKIVQLEKRVDRLDKIVDKSCPFIIEYIEIENKINSIESKVDTMGSNVKWLSILLILLFMLFNTLLFVFI